MKTNSISARFTRNDQTLYASHRTHTPLRASMPRACQGTPRRLLRYVVVGVCEECPPSNCCSHSAQCNTSICVRNCVASCMELLRRLRRPIPHSA
jgi:hypothetical protein